MGVCLLLLQKMKWLMIDEYNNCGDGDITNNAINSIMFHIYPYLLYINPKTRNNAHCACYVFIWFTLNNEQYPLQAHVIFLHYYKL